MFSVSTQHLSFLSAQLQPGAAEADFAEVRKWLSNSWHQIVDRLIEGIHPFDDLALHRESVARLAGFFRSNPPQNKTAQDLEFVVRWQEYLGTQFDAGGRLAIIDAMVVRQQEFAAGGNFDTLFARLAPKR